MNPKEQEEVSTGQRVRARIFSLAVLGGFIGALAYGGSHAYRAATDSFVAPIILSPDSDLVLANKLHASQLSAERLKAAAEIEAARADLTAGERALSRLRALEAKNDGPRAWLAAQSAGVASATASELEMSKREAAVLGAMIEKQREIVRVAGANVEASLVPKTELARESVTLGQLELALVENERTQTRGALQERQAAAVQRALAGKGPPMPELAVRDEQAVRLELEVQRIESELRAKRAERRVLEQKLAKIDELESQLRARPVSRAAEKSLDVAFVPYTQMKGVAQGGTVYDCVWGLFACRPVGSVAELVPGEVALPDPWGNQARGQFAILDLHDHDSAKSRMLRVRPSPNAPRSPPSEVVSSR